MILALGLSTTIQAQYVEQEIKFAAGWNAVWLEVDPSKGEPDVVLAGLDYESVWTYLPEASRSAAARWLVHYREAPAVLNTLSRMQGRRGYLVLARENASLRIKGRPLRSTERLTGGFHNLFGARVDPGAPPSFAEHFSHLNARGKVLSIHELNGVGVRELVDGSAIEPGRAYFVIPRQDISGAEPIRARTGPGGVSTGDENRPFELKIEVPVRSTARFLQVRALASAPPPPGEIADAGAGDPDWLEFRDPASGEFRALEAGASVLVPANATVATIELRAFRRVETPAPGRGGGVGSVDERFQAAVEITDADGNREVVGAAFDPQPLRGLYVGELLLDRVSTHPTVASPVALALAAQFRASLIIRVTERRSVEILSRARVESSRDGRAFEQRYEALLFDRNLPLRGSIGADGGSGRLTVTTTMSADDPLNPYRHRYHPEHREGYDLTREIFLEFTAADQDPERERLRRLGVGAEGLFGTYGETIGGLSTVPIRVRGTFRAVRIAAAEVDQ